MNAMNRGDVMRGTNRLVRHLAQAAVLVSILMLLGGCGIADDGDVWKEEVRLMNGELLVLDRLNRWGDSGDLSVGHGPLTWAEIRFEYKGKQYAWGARGVAPHALQIDSQGRFYVVSSIGYCWSWRERGKPKSFYVVFLQDGEKWVEVPVTDVDVNSVFNISGSSNLPHTKGKTVYQKETDWKYKDDTLSYMKSIVVEKAPSCY